MNCERVRLLLNGYIDDELDLVSALDIEEHLQGCGACSREYRVLQSLHGAVSSKALYRQAPARLEKQIRASLRKASPQTTPWAAISWAWLAPAAGLLLAVLLLVWGVTQRGWFIGNPQVAMAQQVQAAHVRSLQPNHLFDVASTDQHTVKPWFDGKLDFSPPVTDLANQGFPLVGGRLDYLDGRPVAALVYMRNKHVINLFVWPSSENQPSLQSSTYNGYHLFHWSQSGMAFWAVSDLNPAELQTFIQSYRNTIQ